MRVEYDSRADALSIELADAPRWEGSETVDDDYCTIALAGGRVANIELLAPREHLPLLAQAAARAGRGGASSGRPVGTRSARSDGGARRARRSVSEGL